MTIKPIRTDADHALALKELERLWDADPGSQEHDEFEVLATLVDAYEREHHAIAAPDPVEAIKFRMEQAGLRMGDLIKYLGSRSRVSEVLARRRALTVKMISRLHRGLAIPLASLIPPEDTEPKKRMATKPQLASTRPSKSSKPSKQARPA